MFMFPLQNLACKELMFKEFTEPNSYTCVLRKEAVNYYVRHILQSQKCYHQFDQ